jgi:hypothetical protein
LDTSVSNTGVWADHTDTRPTLMALVGLKDAYVPDGRVLTEIMSAAPGATQSPQFVPLAACYKQLNSSVGAFGTDTLVADTHALETSSSGDNRYHEFLAELTALGGARDALAGSIKQELYNAEFNGQALTQKASAQLFGCKFVLGLASALMAQQGG